MDGFTRALAPKIISLLKEFPLVAILGVRQCGKTTLAKQLCPDWRYVDLEDPDDFDLFDRDPKFFFSTNPHSVIFDEAQENPELFKILRGVVDKEREKKGRFILTGSSHPELLSHISESLAGRIAVVELGTLKFSEYFRKPLSPLYSLLSKSKIEGHEFSHLEPQISAAEVRKFWLRGGYPEPLFRVGSWNNWMDNYRKSYVNRDIRKLFPRLDLIRFRRFLSMLATLSGTIINRADLAAAVEVSEPSIKDYIDIAHGTYVWRNLPSLERNVGKAVTKMPKGYIRDSGLLHFMLKISTLEALVQNPIVGRSFEGFVTEELLKGLEASTATHWTAHYYRTRNRAEIDLVIDGEFGLLPIEIKTGLQIRGSDFGTLKLFIKEQNLPLGLLINNSDKVEWIADRILQMPVGCL